MALRIIHCLKKIQQHSLLSTKFLKSLHYNAMSSSTTTPGIPLQEVVNTLESYASTKLAEDWDNVGLLVEPSLPHHVTKLFLTNDLTEDVLEEAKRCQANMILSYHPPLFSSVKRFSQEKWKDRIVVKAMENRIAIYSPHTSYDSIKGGVNDWLVSCFDGDVTPLVPNVTEPENGMGRICNLKQLMDIGDVINKVKSHLNLKHLRVAHSKIKVIQTIASCAGSGSSLLRGVPADLYLTGEMSHHDLLDATSCNTTVILCEHSNTERGFLKVLAPKLNELLGGQVEITVSELDKDPVEIV